MALFDRLTAKKEEKKPAKAGAALRTKKPKKEPVVKTVVPKKESAGTSVTSGILLRPHITEKSSLSSARNAYVFAVSTTANKIEITRAVEGKYGVSVTSVRTLNTNGKARRRGMILGHKPGFKKAIVTVAEGQKIEIQ